MFQSRNYPSCERVNSKSSIQFEDFILNLYSFLFFFSSHTEFTLNFHSIHNDNLFVLLIHVAGLDVLVLVVIALLMLTFCCLLFLLFCFHSLCCWMMKMKEPWM